MDAPGTRYKVVERGRRLEVIDTWNGNAPVNPMRRAPVEQAPRRDASAARDSMRRDVTPPIAATRAAKLDQRGRALLHTKPWYDAKGPRQIVVTQAGAEKLKGLRVVALVLFVIAIVAAFLFWPLLFIAPFFVFNEGARNGLRAASTRFLDELNQPVNGYGGA
ncbi:MAG: hypothetical protein EOP62_05015 [Sphingomonadales bacterium]|nr:MAG: hypothetical protein EOP62_05015 [Sphingomonadales bacterium]